MTRIINGPEIGKWAEPDEQANYYPFENLPDGLIEVPDVTAGMFKRLTRGNVPPGSGRLIRNARIRDDWTGIRPGTEELGGVKPDSDPIIGVVTFVTEAGEAKLCRVTANAFYVFEADLNGWTEYDILDKDGDPADAFIGSNVHFTVTQFFDRMYLADGINPIWEINFASETVQEIKDAPRTAYICTFGDRILAGNVGLIAGGWRPATIKYSGNADPTDWTSESSGFIDLGAENIGDPINGIVAFGEQTVVIRARSIHHITRQPFSTAPFRQRQVIGNLGSDLPFSISKTPYGIIYGDQLTREVYMYTPGNLPVPLGVQTNRDLLTDITSLAFAQGAYDPYENEYHLGIVPEGVGDFITKTWVLGLEKRNWCYDDSPTISCIGIVLLPGEAVLIDDLVGTIDAQTLTINEFGEEAEFTPTLFKGVSTGEVLRQTYDVEDDWNDIVFNFEFVCPNLGSISRKRTLKEVNLAVDPGSGGTYSIAHGKDEATWSNTKSGTLAGTESLIRLPKLLTGKDLYWRLLTASPSFKIKTWFARVLERSLLK